MNKINKHVMVLILTWCPGIIINSLKITAAGENGRPSEDLQAQSDT